MRAPPACLPFNGLCGSAALLALFAAVTTGCQGEVGPSGANGGTTGMGGTGGTGNSPLPTTPAAFGTCPPAGGEPGVTPLLKLSTVQYRNTVRDLLGASGLAAVAAEVAPMLAAIPEDSTVAFRGLDGRVSSDHLQGYWNVAIAVADAATKTSDRLKLLAGACAGTSPLKASCLDAFLASFGKRALRRPLDADELAELKDVATGTSPAPANATEAIRNVVVMLLMSPRFVNHLELAGTPIAGRADDLALDPYEIASRLAYTFWQTLPDDALLAAAADGSLAPTRASPPSSIACSPTRGRRARSGSSGTSGCASNRSPGLLPTARLHGPGGWREPGRGRARPLGRHGAGGSRSDRACHLDRRGTLTDLLTSDESVTASADLARLYGVPAWTAAALTLGSPTAAARGLLQRAALLASSLEQTNPFHRGAFIRRRSSATPAAPRRQRLPPGSLDPRRRAPP